MKAAGASIVYIKATQGTFTDNDFEKNWAGAKEAGLMRGAYHYSEYWNSAFKQATHFFTTIEDDPGELPPALDYERHRYHELPSQLNSEKWIDSFVTNWVAITDIPLIFYTNPSMIKYNLPQPTPKWLLEHDLWIAHYTIAETPLFAPWSEWVFWQYTYRGNGLLFGVESKQIDMNLFNGTIAELKLYSMATMQGATPEPDPEPEECECCKAMKQIIEIAESCCDNCSCGGG